MRRPTDEDFQDTVRRANAALQKNSLQLQNTAVRGQEGLVEPQVDAVIRAEKDTRYRLVGEPQVGDRFEVEERVFRVTAIRYVDGPFGSQMMELSIYAQCPSCKMYHTFRTTRGRFKPKRRCTKCGGKARRQVARARAAKKPRVEIPEIIAPPPEPNYPCRLTPPRPRQGERLSYRGRNCTVKKVGPGVDAVIQYDDGVLEKVEYLKLRNPRK